MLYVRVLQKIAALPSSIDDMVLLALSTSTAVTGFATSIFGTVNSLLGINERPVQPTARVMSSSLLDMSDAQPPPELLDKFTRVLCLAKAVKEASLTLDNLIKIDKLRLHELDRICHFLEKVMCDYLSEYCSEYSRS